MMDRNEYNKRKEIREIEAELKRTDKADRAASLANDLIEASYNGGRVDPADIERFIWHWMDENPLQYPCLMDVYDGNQKKVAKAIYNHMIKLAENGIERTIGSSVGDLERLAARYMTKLPAGITLL